MLSSESAATLLPYVGSTRRPSCAVPTVHRAPPPIADAAASLAAHSLRSYVRSPRWAEQPGNTFASPQVSPPAPHIVHIDGARITACYYAAHATILRYAETSHQGAPLAALQGRYCFWLVFQLQACPAAVPREHQLADQTERCPCRRATCIGDHNSRLLPRPRLRLPALRGACASCQRRSTGKAAPHSLAQGPAFPSLGATSPVYQEGAVQRS